MVPIPLGGVFLSDSLLGPFGSHGKCPVQVSQTAAYVHQIIARVVLENGRLHVYMEGRGEGTVKSS